MLAMFQFIIQGNVPQQKGGRMASAKASSIKKTSDEVFKCLTCNKMFVHRSSASRHEATCRKSKEFLCYHCNRLFLRKDNLKRHIRILHNCEQQTLAPKEEEEEPDFNGLVNKLKTYLKSGYGLQHPQCQKIVAELKLYGIIE